jgi:predicted nucleic acid-binding protein
LSVVYFDSSALVKLLLSEPGRNVAIEVWNGCDLAVSSRLAYAEVCATIAAAGRNHVLDEHSLRRTWQLWQKRWATTSPIEFDAEVELRAGQFAVRHALRGADAVHLASAVAVTDANCTMAVWDRRLHAGAMAEGLAVVPASIDSA